MNNYDYNIERKPFPPFLLFPQANDISILIDESLEQTFHSYIHLSGLHLSCEMAQIAIDKAKSLNVDIGFHNCQIESGSLFHNPQDEHITIVFNSCMINSVDIWCADIIMTNSEARNSTIWAACVNITACDLSYVKISPNFSSPFLESDNTFYVRLHKTTLGYCTLKSKGGDIPLSLDVSDSIMNHGDLLGQTIRGNALQSAFFYTDFSHADLSYFGITGRSLFAGCLWDNSTINLSDLQMIAARLLYEVSPRLQAMGAFLLGWVVRNPQNHSGEWVNNILDAGFTDNDMDLLADTLYGWIVTAMDRLDVIRSVEMSDEVKRLRGRSGHDQTHRVCKPDILACQDDQTPDNKARVFACIDHLCQPVQRRVGVTAAHGFDKGGNGIVMSVTVLVIQDRAPLNRFLGHIQRDVNDSLLIRWRGFHGQLDRVERIARVPGGNFDQMGAGRLLHNHAFVAVASLFIRERTVDENPGLLLV